jgi:hypothetical protein
MAILSRAAVMVSGSIMSNLAAEDLTRIGLMAQRYAIDVNASNRLS